MSLLRDPLREQLNWLTTANHTIIFPPLEEMPEKFSVPIKDILKTIEGQPFVDYTTIPINEAVSLYYTKRNNKKLSNAQSILLRSYYECIINEDFSAIEFELGDEYMVGEKSAALLVFTTTINNRFFETIKHNTKEMTARLYEVADLFGITLSKKNKFDYTGLQRSIEAMIDEDRLPILNLDLILSLADWITDYVIHDKVYAIDNISRLKATYVKTGLPLYSIVESE